MGKSKATSPRAAARWQRSKPMRWIKLLRDLQAEAGRNLIMLAAIGVALFGVMVMLGAYAVVTREVRVNYLSTNPASASIDVAVTPRVLELARAFPGIADAAPPPQR